MILSELFFQLIFLGILLSISIINTYIFFSKTKSYQLFQPNVAQLQNRTNVDVIKIATGEESEKHVWVLHTWNRTQFSAVVFKWFSPLSVLLWYAGRDEILGVQVIFFVCVLFAGWQLSKLADAYEVALEDSKLIAAELFVEGEQAALRHFSRTKKDAGSQTESLYSRGLPSSSRMNLPHARPTPPAAAMSTLYRNANASNSARDFSSSPSPPPPATPLQSYERESNGWGVASPAYSALPVRPMPLNPGMRTSPVMQDNFSSYTSPALHAASQYTPPRDSFMRATPPPATQSPDSMDIDTDYLSSNGNGGASFMQPAPAHRYVDVGLPPAVPSYGGVERTPPRPTNRFSAISPISPASPVLSPPPPTSIQHDLPPTTSLNGF